jgi:hypothetical protein
MCCFVGLAPTEQVQVRAIGLAGSSWFWGELAGRGLYFEPAYWRPASLARDAVAAARESRKYTGGTRLYTFLRNRGVRGLLDSELGREMFQAVVS